MTSRVCVYHILTLSFLVYASSAGPVRSTVNGRVEGVTKTGFPKGDVDFFYGIPFAKPPVGPLRFEDPVEPERWTTTRQATQLPTSCPQIDDDLSYVAFHRLEVKDYGEDCLYLNVFQPKTASTNLAVLLFIHGGSNVVGSGLMFDGGYLASYGDIVVVTMNYRLAMLGFMGTGQPDFRGNYAMMDQIMSMKWVKNNIANFNGDPDRVTILGHSAGSMDVGLHLLSPLSQGLFRRVISQSGPPTSVIAWKRPRTDPLEEARNISRILGCTATTAQGIKQCLKGAKLEDLKKGRFAYTILDTYEFPALMDGRFLPEEPIALMKKKQFSAKEYVIGVTTSEMDYFAQNTKTFGTSIWVIGSYGMFPAGVDVSDLLKKEYTNLKTKGQPYSEIVSCSDVSFSIANVTVDYK